MRFLYKKYRCLVENGWWYTQRKVLANLFGAVDPADDPRWPEKREEFFKRHPERRPMPSIAWLKSRGNPENASSIANIGYSIFYRSLSAEYQIDYPAEDKWNGDGKCRNLLFVTHELSMTGAPVVLLEAVRLCARRGDFCVVVSMEDGPLKEAFLKLGAVVMVPKGPESLLAQFAQVFDCTIVNTLACARFIRPLSGTGADVLWWIHEGSFAIDVLKPIMPQQIGENIHPFCVSEYSRSELEKSGFDYRPGILRIGLQDQAAAASPCPGNHKTTFLTVGAVEKRKGYDILLKAIECLPETVLDKTEFYIVGGVSDTGLEAVICEACAEHDNIHFLGGIPRAELMQLYSQIDCVIIPSKDDPLPTAGVEAAMFSKFIISSDRAGFALFAAQYAHIPTFDCEDYQALAAQIEKAAANPALFRGEGKKLRGVYEQFYSTESFENTFLPLVDSLCREGQQWKSAAEASEFQVMSK